MSLGTGRVGDHVNGHVEQKFSTDSNRVHAMLNSGKFSAFLRNGLWAEAANTATLPENNLLNHRINLSHFQLFWKGKEKHPVFSAKIW